MYNKKGQVWSLDLIVAGVIFLVGIIVLFYYAINFMPESKNQLEEFFYEGNLASELILSEEEFGILSEGKVNETKLGVFDSLSDQDKRNLIGSIHNFYFTLEGLDLAGRNYVGILNTSEVDTLTRITRLTLYNNRPTKFNLYVWN